MALDKALHGKRDPDAVTMDKIRVPDGDSMKKLGDRPYRSTAASAEDVFSDGRHVRQTRIGAADSRYEGTEKRLKDRRYYEERIHDEGVAAGKSPEKKTLEEIGYGKKTDPSHKARKRAVTAAVVLLVLIVGGILFFPPTMNVATEEAKVVYERNIFKDMGMTELKSYALSNYSVYNEEAFSSEKKENYRVIELEVHVQNHSPFEVTLPQYRAVYVPKRFRDKVCYVSSAVRVSAGGDGDKVAGDRIEGFGGKDITIEMMINVSDMTDKQLDQCVTGMILSTEGAKRRIADDIYIPCAPALLFVSDTVTVPIDP